MDNNIKLSVVAPFLNEEEVLPAFIERLTKICSSLSIEYELILVDDGSTDRSYEIMDRAAQKDNRIKVLRFSRNFGHQAAFSAGVDFSQGEMVLTMDGDLQNPPELIAEFMGHIDDGYDIVTGERTGNEQNSVLREFVGRNAYKLLRVLTGLNFKNSSDFSLYGRNVVNTLKQMPERERFVRGMVQWVGFKKKYVPYKMVKRIAGVPKYNFRRLFNLGLSGLTSFSAFPLRLSFWLGILIFAASLIFSGYIVVDHFYGTDPAPAGFATIVILVLFLGSLQLMILGIVGEYLYKMFTEVKGRPFYIVSKTHNLEGTNENRTVYGIVSER